MENVCLRHTPDTGSDSATSNRSKFLDRVAACRVPNKGTITRPTKGWLALNADPPKSFAEGLFFVSPAVSAEFVNTNGELVDPGRTRRKTWRVFRELVNSARRVGSPRRTGFRHPLQKCLRPPRRVARTNRLDQSCFVVNSLRQNTSGRAKSAPGISFFASV